MNKKQLVVVEILVVLTILFSNYIFAQENRLLQKTIEEEYMSDPIDDKFWGGIDFTFDFIQALNKTYKEEQKIWADNPQYRFPKQMLLLDKLEKTLFDINQARSQYREGIELSNDITVYLNELKSFSKYHRAYLNNISSSSDNILILGLRAVQLKLFKYDKKALKSLKAATEQQKKIKTLVLNEFKMTLDELIKQTKKENKIN